MVRKSSFSIYVRGLVSHLRLRGLPVARIPAGAPSGQLATYRCRRSWTRHYEVGAWLIEWHSNLSPGIPGGDEDDQRFAFSAPAESESERAEIGRREGSGIRHRIAARRHAVQTLRPD